MKKKINGLKPGAKTALFIVSYLPLFLILVIRQLASNIDKLGWEFNIALLFNFYLAVFVILIISIAGILGIVLLLRNVDRRAISGGFAAIVEDVDNKNSESISYLFTYLIPFVFNDLTDFVSVISILILISITFVIYTNSNMLLINPVLNMRFTLHEVKMRFEAKDVYRKGFVLTRERHICEGERLKFLELGPRLYYATKRGLSDDSTRESKKHTRGD